MGAGAGFWGLQFSLVLLFACRNREIEFKTPNLGLFERHPTHMFLHWRFGHGNR
jgi:hypothetical protein